MDREKHSFQGQGIVREFCMKGGGGGGEELKSTSLSEKSKSFIFGWPPGWEMGEVMLFQKSFY